MNSDTNETEAAYLGDGITPSPLEQNLNNTPHPSLAVPAIPPATTDGQENIQVAQPEIVPGVVVASNSNTQVNGQVVYPNPLPTNGHIHALPFPHGLFGSRPPGQRSLANGLESQRSTHLQLEARLDISGGADITLLNAVPLTASQDALNLTLAEAQSLLQQILREVQGIATSPQNVLQPLNHLGITSGESSSNAASHHQTSNEAAILANDPILQALFGDDTSLGLIETSIIDHEDDEADDDDEQDGGNNFDPNDRDGSRFIIPASNQKLWLHDLVNFMSANVTTVQDHATSNTLKALLANLDGKSATVLLYVLDPASNGSNVWPDIRDRSKCPVKVTAIQCPNYPYTGSPPTILPAPQQDLRLAQLQDRAKKALEQQDIMHLISTSRGRKPTWPQKGRTLPLEVYQLIVKDLSRDDVKALRMTCKEIEFRISHLLFETVVVPFNTEIYGMLLSDVIAQRENNGQDTEDMLGKMIEFSQLSAKNGLVWKNLGDSDMYNGHGVDVFKGFGPFIRRYGMSFEVDEDLLSSLPTKGLLQPRSSYWGTYDWPYPNYQRFSDIAKLENTADETPKMKLAFSFLQQVTELALSMDNGLGWMHGPDKSLHTRIFKQARPVFGSEYNVAERKVQAQESLWRMLKNCTTSPSDMETMAIGEVRHGLFTMPRVSFDQLAQNNVSLGLSDQEIPRIDLRSLLDPDVGERKFQSILAKLDSIRPSSPIHSPAGHEAAVHDRSNECIAGILAYSADQPAEDQRAVNAPLIPNRLTEAQKEWLLETEWAQGAFISSYLLSVVDNAATFANVHTLNLACMSSRHLALMDRNDFWNGLPQLNNVTILAIAEWIRVWKGSAGIVECEPVKPLAACLRLEAILTTAIAARRNIKTLNVGWATGGEHETGFFGRNQQLMPAPILPYGWLVKGLREDSLLDEMIYFPYVQNLTLTNAWIPPAALVLFVKNHLDAQLGKLILDSISLTTQFSCLPKHLKGVQETFLSDFSSDSSIGFQPALFSYHTLQRLVHLVNPINERDLVNPQPSCPGTQAAHAPGYVPRNPVPSPPVATSSVLPNSDVEINDSWKGPHRIGSWPWVLDLISPGATLASYDGGYAFKSFITRRSKLRHLELRSCGYARIFLKGLDQMVFEPAPMTFTRPAAMRKSSPIVRMMHADAESLMMGTIVQNLHSWEANALIIVWGCQLGWDNEEAAEAATYDGFFKGGSNRISTVLRRP